MSFGKTTDAVRRRLRFVVGGGANTLATYLVYIALSSAMSYQLAYLLAYGMGVAFAYWLNAVWVFRVPLSWRGLFAYPLVYVIQYGASAVFLGALVEVARVDKKLAPLIVAACMVPLTYVASRAVLSWSRNQKLRSERKTVGDDR